MKPSYIVTGFQQIVAERFPARAEVLNGALERRLAQLRTEYADASKEQKRHLERQILPGVAAYEVLKAVMPPDDALREIHGLVEAHARGGRKMIVGLMRLPGLYRIVPGVFARMTRKLFGEAAGFATIEHQTSGGVWRIDMVKCPYHDVCAHYGCPELCACFCDSDDILYAQMHPRLLWHRTKTLGRGGDCCDFCLKVIRPAERGSKR